MSCLVGRQFPCRPSAAAAAAGTGVVVGRLLYTWRQSRKNPFWGNKHQTSAFLKVNFSVCVGHLTFIRLGSDLSIWWNQFEFIEHGKSHLELSVSVRICVYTQLWLYTQLCLYAIVSVRICVGTQLCPYTIVSVRICVSTQLCLYAFVSVRNCACTQLSLSVLTKEPQKEKRLLSSK